MTYRKYENDEYENTRNMAFVWSGAGLGGRDRIQVTAQEKRERDHNFFVLSIPFLVFFGCTILSHSGCTIYPFKV